MELRAISQILVRFARSAGIGALATAIDLVTLALLVEVGGLPPTAASVPALSAGALVQFAGCRHVVFDSAKRSPIRRQAVGFVLVELVALVLNGLTFHGLVALTGLPYGAARVACTLAVFVGFSFPAWHWVFEPWTRGTSPQRTITP
jgi:putative flippase GtrA